MEKWETTRIADTGHDAGREYVALLEANSRVVELRQRIADLERENERLTAERDAVRADRATYAHEMALARDAQANAESERDTARAELAREREQGDRLAKALRGVLGELDRLKVAYSYKLEGDVEPPDTRVLAAARAALAEQGEKLCWSCGHKLGSQVGCAGCSGLIMQGEGGERG